MILWTSGGSLSPVLHISSSPRVLKSHGLQHLLPNVGYAESDVDGLYRVEENIDALEKAAKKLGFAVCRCDE